jgi:hypothetical protein
VLHIKHVEDNDKDVLTHEIVYRWQTPQEVCETLKQDVKTTTLMTALKYLINSKPSAISWHNGEKDGNCQHHGFHLHILTCQTTNEPSIHQTYAYIKLNKAVNEAGAKIKSQKVKLKPNFSRYMIKEPKTFGGCNNNTIKAQILSEYFEKEMDVEPPTPVQRANAPPPTQKTDCPGTKHGCITKDDSQVQQDRYLSVIPAD